MATSGKSTSPLPLPGVKHGERLVPNVVQELAHSEPGAVWVSVPIDEQDLSKGYKDITYADFENAANHAAHWLTRSLPPSTKPFQRFAYTGPKDLRFPILTLAAAKLGKVIVLPSPMVTPEAQLSILAKTNCSVYVRSTEMAGLVAELEERDPTLKALDAPEVEDLLKITKAEPVLYSKSWKDAVDDPWMVFHTSGTTGNPKPITFTNLMVSVPDYAASHSDADDTMAHLIACKRLYTHLPMLHAVGMWMILTSTVYLRSVIVLGSTALAPSPPTLAAVLKYGRVKAAMLPPTVIDAMCHEPESLAVLRSVESVYYIGAPLSTESGNKLSSHVCMAPMIGSTEAGAYYTKIRSAKKDWDYVEFDSGMGAAFEPRIDEYHELVFTRGGDPRLQQIFMAFPELDRFETKDLWIEHPKHKNTWKIVGRADDYVYLANAHGLHAATLEPEIEKHESVRAALIGGHARDRPMLLVELMPDAQSQIETAKGRSTLLHGLQPHIDSVNAKCHSSVNLAPEYTIFAKADKPLVRTIKDSVSRFKSLKLYEDEIAALYSKTR